MECPEVVRIRVKKCDGHIPPQYKNLCVDPQITSFDILHNLLGRAFELQGDFSISYLAANDEGEEVYLSMLSDWDVDAAFLEASKPYLRLKVDLKPFDPATEEWGAIESTGVSRPSVLGLTLEKSLLDSLTGKISHQLGKTVLNVSKVIGLRTEETNNDAVPLKPRMTDAEFHHFMNGVGQMIQPHKFRLMVYQGGVEPSLRKVVWRHLLNIFPDGLTGKERFQYLREKSNEYYKLRDEWKSNLIGETIEGINKICNMVKKDVLRTDRSHEFYAGSDENEHVLSLFNVLVTYAVTHPDLGYCQGMSDIASPILFVQEDESHAFICFCGLMKRLKSNFLLDGAVMTEKFDHLARILQYFDSRFYEYLMDHDAHDLFFCYRWLLLELKREFPLDEALYMLEIMWSSLPPDPPESDLLLFDLKYDSSNSIVPSEKKSSRGYFKLASRHHHSNKATKTLSDKGQTHNVSTSSSLPIEKAKSLLSPLDSTVFPFIEDRMTSQAKDKVAFIDKSLTTSSMQPINSPGNQTEHDNVESQLEQPDKTICDSKDTTFGKFGRPNSLTVSSIALESKETDCSSCEEAIEHPAVQFGKSSPVTPTQLLPSPSDIGHGNPFLLFLCLSLLEQHRDHIIKHHMDYNELAMYFNRLVRKHDVYGTVHKAKHFYGIYLKNFNSKCSIGEGHSTDSNHV